MTRPTDEELVALLRTAAGPLPESSALKDRYVVAAEAIDGEMRDRRESNERYVAEARAMVGKFYKREDYNTHRDFAFIAGESLNDEKHFVYCAVTGCDDSGKLSGWSFVRVGALKTVIELRGPGYPLMTEIPRAEFEREALQCWTALTLLMRGRVDD